MTSLRGLTLTPVGRLFLTAMDGGNAVFQEQKPSITQRPIQYQTSHCGSGSYPRRKQPYIHFDM